jgi:hypothetical protein
MYDALLSRYGGYTLRTLREEDAELLRIYRLAAMGREENTDVQ